MDAKIGRTHTSFYAQAEPAAAPADAAPVAAAKVAPAAPAEDAPAAPA